MQTVSSLQYLHNTPLLIKALGLLGNYSHDFDNSQRLDLHLLDLSDLSDLVYGPIEDLGTLDTSSVSSSAEPLEPITPLEEDIWSFPFSDEKGLEIAGLGSWGTLHDKSFQEPLSTYINGTGQRVLDPALVAQNEKINAGSLKSADGVIQPGTLLASLAQLGMGRESVHYCYAEDKRSFCPRTENIQMSGVSHEAFESLTSSLFGSGNAIRKLGKFVQDTRASTSSFPSRIALSSSFSAILARLQDYLGDRSKAVRSLLQLHLLFERPLSILMCLSDMVEKTRKARNNEEMVSRIYGIIQGVEQSAAWFQPVILQILGSVIRPWLDSVSNWLGLGVSLQSTSCHQAPLPSFVKDIEETRRIAGGREFKVLNYEFEPSSIPSFISNDDARLVYEIGRSLQLLRVHQPEHPLLGSHSAMFSEPRTLQWHFSWKDKEKIQAQAAQYEIEMGKAIEDFNSPDENRQSQREPSKSARRDDIQSSRLSEETAKAYISASISTMEAPLTRTGSMNEAPLADILCQSALEFKDTSVLQGEKKTPPPICLLPVLSSNPIISIQNKLVNHACLRLLFRAHQVISHFSLLHRYILFGDAVFVLRLSHALFDPDIQTTERRKGHSQAPSSRLSLGSRNTWPPASSELRLALMGVLTDNYRSSIHLEESSVFHDELPGDLSFSIREMSETELQQCMNPDSIEALDFLKLEYKPPASVDTVITQNSLLKYDAIFKLLLRAVRMISVVNQLFRDSRAQSLTRSSTSVLVQSFRIESHHFVSTVCSYLFDGVHENWKHLTSRLNDVDEALDRDGFEILASLRDFHEQVLDQMMFALLLRKRQGQVMKLLEEIFGLVLQFARHIRIQNSPFAEALEGVSEVDLRLIYERFKEKVRIFVSECRGLRGRHGHAGPTARPTEGDFLWNEQRTEDGGNTIDQLLLKFEMNGFYTG